MTPADAQVTFCATLVDQWKRMGMRHAVVAPGSRSTPMALALAARTDLQLHVVHDERSAAFIALGIGLSTGVPAALLCTSGTATTHFHAAVVEADLSGVPMLVLTADRPPELKGVGAPQTIDQTELYGDVVRFYADPGVPDEAEAGEWRGFAADGFLAAVGVDPGPVHINLPFREPLLGTAGALPVSEPAITADEGGWFLSRLEPTDLAALLDQPRGLIVAGRGVDRAESVQQLTEALGWPVLADPRSGCRHLPQAVCAFDPLLRHPRFAADHVPTAVLHLGEPPASKVLGQWLQSSGATQVQVHAQRRILDPTGMITERLFGEVAAVCDALTPLVRTSARGAGGASWTERWRNADGKVQAALDAALAAEPRLTEPGVARALSRIDARLVLSSSMPVRDVEWFGATSSAAVFSNRGANGIDGVIATGIGVAAGADRPTVVLLGDVAFCHDQSSLTGLASRQLPLTLVVIDNDGGGIFSFLPQATALSTERFEQLFGTPHGTDLVGLARAHGLGARTVNSVDELLSAVNDREAAVVRVVSDRGENVAVHNRLQASVAAVLD
jgi:2-succinyl-5-enolpyruvyl-6-hydroxy-3-cyclohexene-1-carboxylate synthase